MTRARLPKAIQFALGAGTALVLIVVVIAISAGGGAGVRHNKLVPPARLPPLPQVYSNPAIGLVGRLPAQWGAERGPGFVTLASRDGQATITVLARAVAPGSHPRLLKPVVDSIRQTYHSVTVKHAAGASLGGQPARSVALYTRNQRGVAIRILVAAAQGRRTAWVLEAITASHASEPDLVGAQQIIATIRLVG